MTEQNEEIPKGGGVWGLAGRGKDEEVHFFVSGKCLIALYPKQAAHAEKYLRSGTMWEVFSHSKGKHRLLRLQLNRWNPENPRTCPDCKKYYLTLQEQNHGTTVSSPPPSL